MSKEHANFATLNSMLDYFVLKIRTKKQMDVMLLKSDSFSSSADMLMKNGLLNPSAHLAYYSMFIFLKYVVNNYLDLSYIQQDNDGGGDKSHRKIIDRVVDDLDTKDEDASFDVNRYISAMKHLRAKADYKNEPISLHDVTVHLGHAENIKNIVKPLYGISV